MVFKSVSEMCAPATSTTDVILFGRNSQTGKSSAHQSPVKPSSSRIPKQSYGFSLNKARSYATILFVYSFSARSCLVDKSFVFERSVFTALWRQICIHHVFAFVCVFVFVHTFFSFSFVFSIVFVFVFAFEGSFVLDRMNLGFTLWRQIEEWGAPRAQSQFCQFDCFTVTSATPCQSSSRSSYVSSSFLSSVSSSSSLSSQASSSSSSTSIVFRLIVQFDCVAWSVIIISSRVRWPLAYMISSSWFLIAIIITMIMISS